MINGKLTFGIVGFGEIANHHIQSIQAIENCEFVAITSSNENKRNKVASEYNVEVFSDFTEMCALPYLDVVCICTPNGFHLDPCLAAARNKKHVITEKPMEINVERCKQMISACREAEVTLSCIFQNRYIPGYQKMLELVRDGKLGRLILGNAYVKWYRPPEYYANNNWRGTLKGDGGAALITQSIHYIDQLIHIMGPVKSVKGKISTLVHDIEGEDIGTAILEFENGALGTIEGSTAIYAAFPEKIEVHGNGGSVVLESGQITACKLREPIDLAIHESKGTSSASTDPTAVDVSLHKAQYEHIVSCIRNNRDPHVNGEEGLKSIRVLEAIYESSRTGKEVKLPMKQD
jgi:predicted dehydrogenase